MAGALYILGTVAGILSIVAVGGFGTTVFVIGATCLYVSFYRTRLIPRWRYRKW